MRAGSWCEGCLPAWLLSEMDTQGTAATSGSGSGSGTAACGTAAAGGGTWVSLLEAKKKISSSMPLRKLAARVPHPTSAAATAPEADSEERRQP